MRQGRRRMRISRRRLARIVQAFRGRRLGVVGDLMLDRYIWGRAGRLSPEAPVPVVDFVKEDCVPGGAANVAVNAAQLGAGVTAYGVVGDKGDGFAVLLLKKIAERGVSGAGILPDSTRMTTIKTRVIAGHQQVVRIDREIREPLAKPVEERLIRRIISGLRATHAHALVLSDYDKGVVTDDLASRVLLACRRLDIPALVKPRWSRAYAYPQATAVVLNRAEAAFLVQDVLDDDESVEGAGRKLLAHFNCRAVIVTRAERGMSVFEQEVPRPFHIAALSHDAPQGRLGHATAATGRQVFDVTGAGDTVLATLALAVAAGATMPEAAALANAAAGVVVGKLGTASVSVAELAAALDDID